jgi:hypothetical protein
MITAEDICQKIGFRPPSYQPGRYYTTCPKCSHNRQKAHQKLKCLGVTIGSDGVHAGCNHCGWTDGAYYERHGNQLTQRVDPAALELLELGAEAAERERVTAAADRLGKARWLWSRRQPIAGTFAETYLRHARGYGGPLSSTLGFLPARGKHGPAMIAAFGLPDEIEPGVLAIAEEQVCGVHITRLAPDGSGKAGSEADKIMIGCSAGYPIVLMPPNDLLGLVIAEGIEDTLSAHEATGLGAWAAGSASRLPGLGDAIPSYVECVTLMVDNDLDGRRHSAQLEEILQRRKIEVRSILLTESERAVT